MERFPTEVRATASGFCYHQGAIWAGFVGPVMTAFALHLPNGFVMPMLAFTNGGVVIFIFALLLGPETKGKILTAKLGVA